jgi:3-oxoacid CoA-transferase subunit A
MVYITGDTHGNFDDIEEFCEENETTNSDVLIILGDVGINFYGGVIDRELKERLAEFPITFLCIHGNHERRPESIASYKKGKCFGGGIVYVEPEFPNLRFARDGEVYKLAGKRCLVIGGAYSVDKDSRTPGVDWWADEQPSEEIMIRVERKLDALKWRVDAVLSHTCPYQYRPTEQFSGRIWVDHSTEKWLDEIEKRLRYKEWWCGHFHTEKFYDKMHFMYNSIIEFDEY